MEVNLPFLLCFTLYLRVIFQVQAGGRFKGGFFALPLWGGVIHEGAYFRNFTVGCFTSQSYSDSKEITKKRDTHAKLLLGLSNLFAFVTLPLPSPSPDLKVPNIFY